MRGKHIQLRQSRQCRKAWTYACHLSVEVIIMLYAAVREKIKCLPIACAWTLGETTNVFTLGTTMGC
jgi:hypothetical protein